MSLVERTIAFVQDGLRAWRIDDPRTPADSENILNVRLADFLEVEARHTFAMVHFSHQQPQGGMRTVDIAAKPTEDVVIQGRTYGKYDPFLVIEGKRLPAPAPKAREREYVTGGSETTGGIQRFKLCAHAAELNIAILVGFLQEGRPSRWHRTINKWIADLVRGVMADGCAWATTDRLQPLTPSKGGVSKCQSSHARIGAPTVNDIEVHHLWVKCCGRAAKKAK